MKILIIDDEEFFREDLKQLLIENGYDCKSSPDGKKGIESAFGWKPDVVLCDIALPDIDGVSVVKEIKNNNPELHIIMITAFGTLDTAVESFRSGAGDYLLKPLRLPELLHKLQRINEYKFISKELETMRRFVSFKDSVNDFIGKSQVITKLKKDITESAYLSRTILISGETGTGKEVVARMIYNKRSSVDKKIIPVNCAAVPASLIESELFGHVKGAFTGALTDKQGLFEIADKGTIYLDEIGELPMAAQAKLLRVLETGEIMRVGGVTPVKVNIKIISSTNRDLKKMIEENKFRSDLYYRLNTFELYIPPLRERAEDIPLLIDFFIKKFKRRIPKKITGIESGALTALMTYSWPGNVRELEHLIERSIIVSKNPVLKVEDFPNQITNKDTFVPSHFPDDLQTAVKAFEKAHIRKVLDSSKNKIVAAQKLNVDVSTLYRKLQAE